MKTRLFIAAALFAALVGIGYCVQANAADLPSAKAPPAPVVVVAPVDLWSGAYGGIIAGVGFSSGHAKSPLHEHRWGDDLRLGIQLTGVVFLQHSRPARCG